VHDGTIIESSETSGLGGTMDSTDTTIDLGDDASRKQSLGILSFNTSIIPDNATITKITLKLKKLGVVGPGDPLVTLQGFMLDVKNGYFSTFPALQLADFNFAPSATYGPFIPTIVGDVYNINLLSASGFINKVAVNNGITQIRVRLKLDDNNDAIANMLNISTGEATLAIDRPQLVITYTLP
jgi:hypothetical protein